VKVFLDDILALGKREKMTAAAFDNAIFSFNGFIRERMELLLHWVEAKHEITPSHGNTSTNHDLNQKDYDNHREWSLWNAICHTMEKVFMRHNDRDRKNGGATNYATRPLGRTIHNGGHSVAITSGLHTPTLR
jgi:hypothetical protein